MRNNGNIHCTHCGASMKPFQVYESSPSAAIYYCKPCALHVAAGKCRPGCSGFQPDTKTLERGAKHPGSLR